MSRPGTTRAAATPHVHGAGCGHGAARGAAAEALDRPPGEFTAAGARASAAPYAVTPPDERARAERIRKLKKLLEERVVLLDGAMGTMIQRHKLDEAGYRGERYRDYGRDLRGNNDLLTLTRPEIIAGIHRAYFEAGSDIVETNTFNSTSVAQADYGMEALVPELNYRAARLAREVADDVAARTGEPRFVAGAIGPTSRTASLSPDVNDPAMRNVTFDELVDNLCRRHAGAAAGWFRPDPRRDCLRHAERQGCDLRGALRARGVRARRAGDRLGHDHRRLRAHPVGADHGGVLEFGAPR